MWRWINQGDSQQYQPPAGRAPPTKPTVTLKPVKAPDLPTNIQDVQGTEKQIRRHFGNPISKIQAVRNSREQVTCSLNKMAREKESRGRREGGEGGGKGGGREENLWICRDLLTSHNEKNFFGSKFKHTVKQNPKLWEKWRNAKWEHQLDIWWHWRISVNFLGAIMVSWWCFL